MRLLRLDGFRAIHPAWVEQLRGLCEETGVYPGSTWRSSRLQACWFECASNGCRGCSNGLGCHGVIGHCPSANPAGYSFHEYAEWVAKNLVPEQLWAEGPNENDEVLLAAALACDLSWDDDSQIEAAHAVCSKYDLHFPIMPPAVSDSRKEIWHVQPGQVPGRSSPEVGWTPYEPVWTYIEAGQPVDPWDDLFVPIFCS